MKGEYSLEVPYRLQGSLISDIALRAKFMNSCNLSSPM